MKDWVETVIGGFWGNAPSMGKLAMDNKIKGYNFPQGCFGTSHEIHSRK
jgi:acyl CoA:acetate/3-ketoacid CoA transferase